MLSGNSNNETRRYTANERKMDLAMLCPPESARIPLALAADQLTIV